MAPRSSRATVIFVERLGLVTSRFLGYNGVPLCHHWRCQEQFLGAHPTTPTENNNNNGSHRVKQETMEPHTS
jgi:hypothetical protein